MTTVKEKEPKYRKKIKKEYHEYTEPHKNRNEEKYVPITEEIFNKIEYIESKCR